MSWASPRNGHGSGLDDGKKTAKWLMRQAEKTDQQTVFLLNLLQEHRLEIEARDDVMRESSKVISKLQAENDSLKQQLEELELRNALVAGDKRRQHTSPDADCLPDRQTISNGNFSSTVSEPPVDCQHRPAGQDSEVLRGSGGGGSSSHARSRCSTLLEAWARVRVTSQGGSSSEQSSNRSIDGLPTSTAVRQPCSRMPTSGQPQELTSVPARTFSPAVEELCQQQEGPSHVPGSGRHTRAAAQQPTLSHREQHQRQLVQPTQLRPTPLPQHELRQQQDQQQQQQEPSTELKQLEVPFVTSTKEVDLSRAQWKVQQSQPSRPQQQPADQQHRQQQSPPQPSPQQLQPALGAAYPAQLSAELASLRCSLETAKQQTTEAQDKYLTCKKDLEVLTHKYNSLMVQKLEIEEEYNHLFHPDLEISLLRQAIPSVDSAMTELEERLQEVMDILASNQLEVEDTLRAHNATRRKWMTKLEDLQTQLADRDARLRKAEAQLLAAAVGTGMGPSGTGMGVGARMSPQHHGICGTTWRKREEETSSGDQVASPETRDNGLRRVASGGASMCGGNGGVDSSGIMMARHAFVGALSST